VRTLVALVTSDTFAATLAGLGRSAVPAT
jgi:hypothetical protein